ncbi:hypothetical protein KMI7_162 [Klebsiella phage KMI7]|nr:hypothetical protein KMI7_162 [Klebsiella phage KMI7]
MNIDQVFAQALEQELNTELDLYRYNMEEQIRGNHKNLLEHESSRREVWKHTFFENLSAGVTKASARANKALEAFDNAFEGE